MKKYDFKINGKQYNVEIKDFQVKSAKVDVNGKVFDVEINYPESTPAMTVPRPVPSSDKKEEPEVKKVVVNSIKAPMPGLIIKLDVNVGDTVTIGQKVAVMEAMKMENDINSTYAGTVKEINVKEGDNVQENQTLIVIG